MTENEVRKLLIRAAEAEGTKALAARAGVSTVFINSVKRGAEKPSDTICRALGLRRVVTYEIAEASSVAAFDPTSGDGVGGDGGSPRSRPRGV